MVKIYKVIRTTTEQMMFKVEAESRDEAFEKALELKIEDSYGHRTIDTEDAIEGVEDIIEETNENENENNN